MFHSESFWKNKQPLFSENRKIRDKIALVDENENIISEEHIVSEELNNFFKSETESENPYIIEEKIDVVDLIIKAINKYKHHPSILLINSKLSSPESFSFNKINNNDFEKEIKLLNIKINNFIQKHTTKIFKTQCT